MATTNDNGSGETTRDDAWERDPDTVREDPPENWPPPAAAAALLPPNGEYEIDAQTLWADDAHAWEEELQTSPDIFLEPDDALIAAIEAASAPPPEYYAMRRR
jgi:hypothetical protein